MKYSMLMMILQVRPAVESVVEDIKSGGQPADVIRCVVMSCVNCVKAIIDL